MPCSSKSPTGCARRCAPSTSPIASAARSSWSCFLALTCRPPRLAEQLRAAVAAEPAAGLWVTMSFGVAGSTGLGLECERLLDQADTALYEAKARGRDRVVAAPQPAAAARSPAPDALIAQRGARPPRLPAPWPAYPQETPRRPTARCPPRRWRASGRGRSGSTCTCRSARRAAATATSTRTSRASAAPSRPAATSRPCWPRSTSRRGCSAPALPRVDTVFFGGGTPTLLPAGDLIRILRRIDERFGLDARRRGHHRGQPRVGRSREAGGVARGRLHAPLARDAERGAARAGDPRPRALARPPAAGGRRGARRRLRAGQPRPDLRHAGRDRRRLARFARRRAERRARPPLDLLADRRARHADGRAGPPRRARRARRGRDRRPLRDRRARARRGRAGVVRDLLVGDRRGRLVPAQPRLLGRRRLVGRGTGRAQPRRRRALVERAAPAGVDRAARRRHVTRRGPRDARRRTRSAWSA